MSSQSLTQSAPLLTPRENNSSSPNTQFSTGTDHQSSPFEVDLSALDRFRSVDATPAIGTAAQRRILGHMDGKRVLLIAAGGGGDIAGTLPCAWTLKNLGADVQLAGLSLKRTAHDPLGLARSIDEFDGIQKINNFIGKVDPNTYIHHHDRKMIYHIEADISLALEDEFPVYSLDPSGGIGLTREAIKDLSSKEGIDHVIVMDVGGDILCEGHEESIRSPLCDTIVLGAAAKIPGSLTGVIGLGSDGEFPLAGLEKRVNTLRETDDFHGGFIVPTDVLADWGTVLRDAKTECSKHPMRICTRNLDPMSGDYNQDMYRVQAILDRVATSRDPNISIQLAADVDREDVALRGGARVGELSALSAFKLFFGSDTLYNTSRFSSIYDEGDSFEECGAKLDVLGIIHEIHDRD